MPHIVGAPTILLPWCRLVIYVDVLDVFCGNINVAKFPSTGVDVFPHSTVDVLDVLPENINGVDV